MKVCVVMAVAQLLIWAVWAGITRHPSRWKLWLVVVGGGLAMLLEIYDFPPYEGFLDAHAVWHATTIPLTYIWWSFIRDDAEFLTSNQVKKLAKKAKQSYFEMFHHVMLEHVTLGSIIVLENEIFPLVSSDLYCIMK